MNDKVMDLIIADVAKKRLYVTKKTMKRSKVFVETAKLIKEYKLKYPTFQLEVNETMIKRIIGFIPA